MLKANVKEFNGNINSTINTLSNDHQKIPFYIHVLNAETDD